MQEFLFLLSFQSGSIIKYLPTYPVQSVKLPSFNFLLFISLPACLFFYIYANYFKGARSGVFYTGQKHGVPQFTGIPIHQPILGLGSVCSFNKSGSFIRSHGSRSIYKKKDSFLQLRKVSA